MTSLSISTMIAARSTRHAERRWRSSCHLQIYRLFILLIGSVPVNALTWTALALEPLTK
jgi:hypothetical protein